MKKRILFVDDEPEVLESIRRALRSMRGEWEMAFVPSAGAALETMEREPFDVIVSDVRMPQMDGVELFREVMKLYPGTVRIALSAYTGRETFLRSIRAAHQFLAKPCEPDRMRDVVTRALHLRSRLDDNSPLHRLLARLHTLPSLPILYLKIMKEVQSRDPSLARVGEIIASDIGMSAKVLQIVNSVVFGTRYRIQDPVQATVYLGMDLIRALVLSAKIFEEFDTTRATGFSMEELWGHSTLVSVYGRKIAEREGASKPVQGACAMAGMLHDVGKVILAYNLPDSYETAIALSRREGISMVEAENAIFETSHAEVGAYVMGMWGLPESIVDAVLFHHRLDQFDVRGFTPMTAVCAGNLLHHEQTQTRSDRDEVVAHLERQGLAERLTDWTRTCNPTAG